MKKMILVTDSFPYGTGESTFILPELNQLAQEFEIAIVSCGSSTERTSGLPADIGVYHCPKNQTSWVVGCFKALLSPMVYREMGRALRRAKHPLLALLQCIDYYGESESFARQFRAVVEAEGLPDIVYCFWHRPALFGILRTKKYYPGVKVVSRAHGYDLYAYRYPTGYIPYKQECDHLLDRVFLACRAGLEYYRENHSVSFPEKFELACLGADNTRTAPWQPDDTLRLFSCSNLISVKRVDMIVEALAKIKDLRVRWVHAGGGKLEDSIRRLAADRLDGSKNIEYTILGAQHNDDIRERLATEPFDYFITTTESEGGVPASIVEACSFGLPVIATDVGGVPEIADSDNGFLLPGSCTVDQIAEALERAAALRGSAEYAEMRTRSQQKWRDGFIATENAKKFTRRLLDICEK